MGRKLVAILICVILLFTMTACGSSRKAEEEAEKAKQEEIEKQNAAAANAFISAVETLPEHLKLEDETQVAGARALYDDLTDEQKALVPADMLAKLEDAEKTIEDHRAIKEERDRIKAENKEAAAKAEAVINGIPDNVTLDAEGTVQQARAAYNELTDDQKKFVGSKAADRLASAEAKIQELKEEKQKAEEEKERKKEEKKKKKEEAKKKKQQKKEKAQDKYAIAKKYVGKKASALIAAVGKPNKKKKNPNCATDGEEYVYYYDGFYVGVLSQDMDSPLIVQNVVKN